MKLFLFYFQLPAVVVQQNQSGTERICYVDPTNPENALLMKRSPWLFLIGFVPLILMGIGFGGFLLVRFPQLEMLLPELNFRPIVLLPAAFVLAGIIPFVFITLIPSIKYLSIEKWSERPCKIEDSTIIEDRGRTKNRVVYSPQIRYRYESGGKSYLGEKIDLIDSSRPYVECQELVAAYPAGKELKCWVNPADPSEAVLNKDYPYVAKFGFVLLIFPIVGMVIFYFIRPRSQGF